MKSGQMFWGFFLLTLGALFLFTKYDLIQSSFDFVWNIWPLFFVFWGAVVMFKHTMVKPVVSGLFGVFLALLIFGIFYSTVWGFDYYYDEDKDTYTEYYIEDYSSSIKNASMEINSGAGKFIIKGTTDKLVEGRSYGSLGEYDFRTDKEDSTADVSFNMDKRDGSFFHGKFRNHLVVSMNPNPIWDIRFNIGASKSNFDLSEYKVSNVELHTGATNTRIKLGDKLDSVDVHIEMGAASTTIEIPKTTGCSVSGDMVLMSKDFPGFHKQDNHNYETENFNNCSKKVFISIDAGVSAIKIIRY
jgi:hypothetical protein